MTGRLFHILALGLVAAVPSATQADTLAEATESLANKTVLYLKEKGITELRVDKFTGPQSAPTGMKIQSAIRNAILACKDYKVNCSPKAGTDCYSVTGAFKRAKIDDTRIVVKISCKIIDKEGGEDATLESQFQSTVDESEDVAAILATTVDLTTKNTTTDPKKAAEENPTRVAEAKSKNEPYRETEPLDSAQQESKVKASIEKPSCHISDLGQVSPAEGSAFAIAIKVRKAGEKGPYELRKPTVNDEGKAIIDLNVGEDFVVCAYNKSPYRAGLALELDGLNVFEFSENEAYKKQGKWVLFSRGDKPHYEGTINGWYINDEDSKKFRITQLPESALAALGKDTNSNGAITAIFSTAWEVNGPVHPEEFSGTRSGGAGGKGIGIGEQFADKKESVPTHFGLKTLAVITIRYTKPESDLPPPK